MDLEQIGVGERGQCPCFTTKSLDPTRLGSDFIGKDLDRDLTVELGVAGAPHLTHPTGPDGAEDFIPAETITL